MLKTRKTKQRMKLSLLLAISLTFGTIHGFTQTHKTPTAEQLQDSKDSIEDARTDSVHEAIDKAIRKIVHMNR